MNKFHFLWFWGFLLVLPVGAQPPSTTILTTAAKTHMQVFCPGTSTQNIGNIYKNAISAGSNQWKSDALMNVIEYQNGGWILMSNDMNVEPVLAYSESGKWNSDTSRMPPGLVELLLDYMEQITEIKVAVAQQQSSISELRSENQAKWQGLQSASSSYVRRLTQSKASDVPMLMVDESGEPVSWNQSLNADKDASRIYNKFAPKGCKTGRHANGSDHFPIGCASVAMGQLMWYWKFPPQYDWDRMPTRLTKNSSVQEENNIAHLLKRCATEALVCYACAGSWTFTSSIVLALHNMDFPAANKKRRGDNDDGEWWPDLIRSQLRNGWPVIYRGDKADLDESKHFWVIDGYKQDGTFHCNWGWGGSHGYFLLNDLFLDEDNDYRKNNMIIRNIYPEWDVSNTWSPLFAKTIENDDELRVFCKNAKIKRSITLKGNSQSKIAFTGDLTITAPFSVSEGATLTLACYDKEANSQQSKMSPPSGSSKAPKPGRKNPQTTEEEKLPFDFSLSPNPATNEVTILMKEVGSKEEKLKEVFIYDAQGQLCVQTKFADIAHTIALPMLATGIYVVKVSCSNQSSSKKLIIR